MMSGPAVVDAALQLYDIGLAVVPAVAKDGKSVEGIVKGFQKWRCRLPRPKVDELFRAHQGACIALLVRHCGLVVVDCDDDDALTIAEARFGYTPILVRTPSGRGGHLYYRAPTEPVRAANLRKSHGLKIDIKAGKGAYVIAPPSVRPSTGTAYCFERGGWSDLATLPTFQGKAMTSARIASSRLTNEGERNDHLFRRALAYARDCETGAELALKVSAINESECDPPLPWDEVERVAESAWRYQVAGQNRVGRGRYVTTPEALFERLMDAPDAFAFDVRMRLTHEGLRARFAASPKGMAAANLMPGWTAKRYRDAIQVLVDRGVWNLLKQGGRGPGDAHQYGFAGCSLRAIKGAKSTPNTNKRGEGRCPPRPSAAAASTG